MGFALPGVRIGTQAGCSGLTVFPLFAAGGGAGISYLLGDEAIERDLVTVQETGESGSVPNLTVDNFSDSRVLFLEGEELVGAKQNRVLNSTILLAPHSRTVIPVSCVEQGRWRHSTRGMSSSGRISPHRLRRTLRSSVTRSLRETSSHRSDQGEVWGEVSRQMSSLRISSSTQAMSDTFEAHEMHLKECRDNLHYVDGSNGLAVALGSRVSSLDLFDKPATCRKVWDRLLSGAILAALEVEEEAPPAAPEDVERAIERAAALAWEQFAPVGEGEEFRCESPAGDLGAALVLDGVMIHGSLVAQE